MAKRKSNGGAIKYLALAVIIALILIVLDLNSGAPAVTSSVSTSTINNTITIVASSVSTNATNATATSTKLQTPYNYFNLTGVGIMNQTSHRLGNFTVVNNVTNVSITLNKTRVNVGELFKLNVTFSGQINFNGSDAFLYYVFSQPKLINNHYFGVEYANETNNLTVQSNGPWYYFISQVPPGKSYTYTPTNKTFRVVWNLTATPNVTGKTLKFCSGFFASYANSTAMGGWSSAFDTLAREQAKVVNNSVINVPGKCVYLQVD
jgi:hypothetical protein